LYCNAAAFSAGGMEASVSTQARNAASAALPLAIRSPPVCRIRAVGLSSSRDCAGSTGFTNSTKDLPNASIRAGGAPASGNRKRVGEATPSPLWQARHPAFSKIG
jgi:hypothetical protein